MCVSEGRVANWLVVLNQGTVWLDWINVRKDQRLRNLVELDEVVRCQFRFGDS
jgi:hypothetical protein